MVSMYIISWFLAVLLGSLLACSDENKKMNTLNASWLAVALISVSIALFQWTDAFSLGIYAADMPTNARPFGNVAQPNHLSTICFLGLCGLFWLQQQRRVMGLAFWFAAIFLLWGMVMSQSRTGYVQIGFLIIWSLSMRDRVSLQMTRLQLFLLGVIFILGVTLWPTISEALFLSKGRELDNQLNAGVRIPYWLAMLDALFYEPWWGYGWEQAGAAQQRVALNHSLMGTYFHYSHNFVIDLLLWNGIVIGGIMIFILAWWFFSHGFRCREASLFWLFTALIGIFLHGLTEYPLTYAYFLIPVGIIMGAIDRMSNTGGVILYLPRWGALLATLGFSMIFIFIAIDYVKLEESYRTQRMEIARIGIEKPIAPIPKLYLLTQMEAFLQIANINVTSSMTKEEIHFLQIVSLRFPYPAVLLRYAEALALNDNPEEAIHQVRLLRQIWNPIIFANINNQLALSNKPEIRKISLKDGK